MFSCSENGNSQRPLEHFSSFFETSPSNFEDSETYIGKYSYKNNIALEHVDVIMNIANKHWFQLQSLILSDGTVLHDTNLQARNELSTCLGLISLCVKNCTSEHIKASYVSCAMKHIGVLSQMVIPAEELEQELAKLTLSSIANERSPLHQYLHALLDMHYYLLLCYVACSNIEEFEKHLHVSVQNLILIALKNYHQGNKSAFFCSCNEKFWLVTQLLSERVLGSDYFWIMFNTLIEKHDASFSLWLMKDVAALHGFNRSGQYQGSSCDRIKPNHLLLETAVKQIFKLGMNSASAIQNLQAIEPLICNLWLKHGKIEIYQTLWDYFSKRLNVASENVSEYSVEQLIEQTDNILWTPKNCSEDFEFFLGMLVTHLTEHPQHWAKLKGRIYSQLGPNKTKDMEDVGLHHVLLLFTALTRMNFEEMSKKIVSFLQSLPQDRLQCPLIWNFYAAFIIRHIKENRGIEPVVPLFVSMLEEASKDQNYYPLLKDFVANLRTILKYSTNLQLQQWLLIENWICKYITTCYYADLLELLDTLLEILERVNADQVWHDWEPSFKNYVYPSLKYVCSSSSGPEQGGRLAAKISLLCPSLVPEAFIFFNGEGILPRITRGFLSVVLENYSISFVLSASQEALAIQSWVKISLLTKESQNDVTGYIVKLDQIPAFMKTQLRTAPDPVCTLINCLGTDIQSNVQSMNAKKLTEICFGEADRWISQYIAQPENEGVVLRIYTCIALAFFKIGHLLYNKYKTSSPFVKLTSAMLLPTELMIGKALHPFVLQAVKKTWHIFFEATVKLNTNGDAYIDRTLRDLIVKFMPHFSTVDSPMLKCLDNQIIAEYFLNKVSEMFFKQPTREAESNVFKSLRIINGFVQSTTSVPALKVVVTSCLYNIFETAMCHSQRNAALALIKNITASTLYPQVKDDFTQVIGFIVEKHMYFNSINLFQLLESLSKFIACDLKGLLGTIKQQISTVEKMRGVGFDKNLRQQLQKLEMALL